MTEKSDSLPAQDWVEISQLMSEYNFHLSAGNAEAYAATYTMDGTFVGLEGKAVTGRDNLVKFIQARNAKPSVQTRTHWASNIIIRPSANGATAESYQMTVDQGGETFRVSGTHIKVDELRRENGKWRFYHRRSVPMARK